MRPIIGAYNTNEEKEEGKTEIGIDYAQLLIVLASVGVRHAKVEEWRIEQDMVYIEPQRQEKNHIMVLTSLKPHFEKTPEIKKFFKGIGTKYNNTDVIGNLGIDILFKSPNPASQQLALDYYQLFL